MDWILSKMRLVDVDDDSRVYFKNVQSYADCKLVIDNYKMGVVCIYSLEPTNNPDAQGMLNYICGGIYALGGDVSTVGESVFITRGSPVLF